MARKTMNYHAQDGRDHGKLFVITEMSAAQAESWAMRVLLALMANDVNMPTDDFDSLGMAGLAQLGLKSLGGLKYDVAEPLLNEMLQCVEIVPDPKKPHVKRRLVDDDIEEVSTRLKIRMEVLKLHTDFLDAAGPSIFPGKRQPKGGERATTGTSRR